MSLLPAVLGSPQCGCCSGQRRHCQHCGPHCSLFSEKLWQPLCCPRVSGRGQGPSISWLVRERDASTVYTVQSSTIPGLCLGLFASRVWRRGGENFGATVLSNRTVLWDFLSQRQGRERQVYLGVSLLTQERGLSATLRCMRRQGNIEAAWMLLGWMS